VIAEVLVLVAAGSLAGAMNAVAGGGSFVSFPALILAGVPPVAANASSTVALLPGGVASAMAYRDHYRGVGGIPTRTLLAITTAGGVLGAWLLLVTPERIFGEAVPWLLLFGALTFALGGWSRPAAGGEPRIGPGLLLPLQFALGIYAGYFGGAVGIMMLGAWSLLGESDLLRMNAAKVILVTAANGVAVVLFVAAGVVAWPQTVAVLLGAAAGGYAGARWATSIRTPVLRRVIHAINFTMVVVFFWRTYGG
jgi:uncharacterized protein